MRGGAQTIEPPLLYLPFVLSGTRPVDTGYDPKNRRGAGDKSPARNQRRYPRGTAPHWARSSSR